MPRRESAVVFVEVATTETTDVPNGVVVPKDDGVVDPLTAPLNFANGAALTRCRGASVWKSELSDETSIWR